MNQLDTHSPSTQSQPEPAPIQPLRIVLLADDKALYRYGPVLRRLTVGLIDEVADLSLVCLEPSQLLSFVPSPPVRLIGQAQHQKEWVPRSVAHTTRQVTIATSMPRFLDKWFTQRPIHRLVQALSDYKPTLIHAMSEKQQFLARRLSKLLRIPYVVSVLSSVKIPASYSDQRCGAILCCNSHLVRKIRQTQPGLAKRIHLLPVGTHVTEKICCFDRDDEITRVFCCAPLEPKHGVSLLINAVKRTISQGHAIDLTISGKGSSERDFRHQVKRLELGAQVNFVPPISAMISINDAYKLALKEADIYVQPWAAANWQPQLLEAMSVGCATIVTQGQNNDLVIPHKTALTFAPDDEQALADHLASLIADRPAAQTLAKNAQKHLKKHFLASQMITSLVKAYKRALELTIPK